MLFNALTDVAEGQVLKADVCIVGSGAAGMTLALALQGRGLSVIVLEAGGPTETTEAIQDAYRGRMSGIRTWEPHRMRRRQLGGSTTDWAGWCMPLEREDFLERPWIPRSGWPITYDELAPYYALANRILELGDVPWDRDVLLATSPHEPWPSAPREYETRFFRFSPPTRFGPKYGPVLAAANDVAIYLFANVVEIVLDDARKNVSRLECRAYAGSGVPVPFRVEAARFVLAMGGIENARILLASRSQEPGGVANGSGFVGRCFMEHPHYYSSAGLIAPNVPDLGLYLRHAVEVWTGASTQKVELMGVWAPTAALRESLGLVDFTIELSPGMEIDNEMIGANTASALLARRDERPERVGLTIRAEQTPDEESRVMLSEEVDALGVPRVDLRWTIRREDDVALKRALVAAGVFVARTLGGRLFVPSEGDRFDWTPLPGGHHMGTTRMAANARDGVVDRNCRCFDVENLYIAGSSVFPTGGSANPTLTIVALATRLADHLLTGS